MESSSQSDLPPKSAATWPGQVMGTIIALLTLVIPLLAIAYFSSQPLEPWPPAPYPVLQSTTGSGD
jgi:hypothetical protein